MVKVTELAYFGFNITDGDAWRDYAANCIGMEVRDDGESDRFYLRMDHWHHRFVMHIGKEDDLAYTGWRVAGPRELEAMARQLDDAKIKFKVGTAEQAQERHVLGLLKTTDPGGNPTEIFYGPRVDTNFPFYPGRRMYGGFVTGNSGIGHCILREDDVAAAAAFYEVLGLSGSVEYKLKLPNGMVAEPYFMHCNDRQHSIAFGLGPQEKRINHLMLEYQHLDDLGAAHDIIRKRKIDVALQLGKHSNDQALTFYMASPSGWLVELGWGARKALAQQEYFTGDIFGHGPEAKGYGMDLDL
jgi:2,3-dihydroxyethylbenzene 1,2-dioxygenase